MKADGDWGKRVVKKILLAHRWNVLERVVRDGCAMYEEDCKGNNWIPGMTMGTILRQRSHLEIYHLRAIEGDFAWISRELSSLEGCQAYIAIASWPVVTRPISTVLPTVIRQIQQGINA